MSQKKYIIGMPGWSWDDCFFKGAIKIRDELVIKKTKLSAQIIVLKTTVEKAEISDIQIKIQISHNY